MVHLLGLEQAKYIVVVPQKEFGHGLEQKEAEQDMHGGTVDAIIRYIKN